MIAVTKSPRGSPSGGNYACNGLVAGGHQTDVQKESVYSSVVSRDSVRIALMIASLNNLNVLAADVHNAYLKAPTKEKCDTIAGPEFGPDK
jgi:hypothetical protein